MFHDEGSIRIPDLVHTATFPIYGLINNSLGFSVRSVSQGNIGEPPKLYSIGFTFSREISPGTMGYFKIGSSTKQQMIVYNSEISSHTSLDHRFSMDTIVFEQYQLPDAVRRQAGNPHTTKGEFVIDSTVFTGKIHSWSQPYQISWFLLEHERMIFSGSIFGFSENMLIQLLQELVIISHRDEVLERYQQELDQASTMRDIYS